MKKKIDVILEINKDGFWARVEGKGNYLPNGYGETKQEALDNLVEVIKDYQAHEGKNDKFWKVIDANKIEWDVHHDLQAFFEEYDFLNVSAIARRAGLNSSLVRQYASGVKHPSSEQVKKIEIAVHKIARELQEVAII
jgi:hypothetical protein